MKRPTATLILISAFALSGCTGDETFGNPARAQIAQGNHEALAVSLLRVAESDVQALPSPEALAKVRSIVAAGVVDGRQEGPALATYPNGPLEHRVIFRIKVTHPLKGIRAGKPASSSMIYVDLFRGAVARDNSKKPEGWLPRKSVACAPRRSA